MKAKIALLLLSVGLFVSLTSDMHLQATEDTSTADRSIEYIHSVSPDMNHAVLKKTSWDNRGLLSHGSAELLEWRLVKVLDIRQGLFETIRELSVEYNAIEFCDTNTIIITVLSEPRFDQHLRKLMLYKLREADSITVLYDRALHDSSSAVFAGEHGVDFKFRDSILAYTSLEVDSSLDIRERDFNVVIRRLTADGAIPVVREFSRAAFHNFSQDGRQILYQRMDISDTSFNLATYDIARDSITEYPDVNGVFSAQRQTENSPIYYLSSPPGSNIRCFDPQTGTDTSLVHMVVGESHVMWFALSGDSIVYEAIDWREGKRESRISTINLK